MLQAITIRDNIGVGDKIQFSSLPENYFRTTGKKLLDLSRPWFFDANPYVIRTDQMIKPLPPVQTTELWNFPQRYPWPKMARDNPSVYTCNAEIHASIFKCKVTLNRPRLYRYEDVPFEARTAILLHTDGRSHGEMPDHVIEHVISKYRKTGCLFQIGLSQRDIGIPRISTPSLWDLAKVISEARMLICMDSGPSWIAACYPDVVIKKLRTKPTPEHFEHWVPLSVDNIHSHWDDRAHHIFNPTEDDIGFTTSYKRI